MKYFKRTETRKAKEEKVLENSRRKALIFVLSWVVLAVVSYMLIFYSGGKFAVAKELQKTYTIDTQEAYQLQMKGFDIQNGFLVSDESKNVSLSINDGSNIDFKYMTIEVESIGLAGEQVNIFAQSENGETFDGTIELNQGSNIINFGKKDNWQNIQLNFNDIEKNSILVFNIQNITFSEHKLSFNGSLFLFLFLFVIFGVLSFLFVYRSFAQWLKIHPAFILAVILLLQVSQIIYYMDKRKDFHVDEINTRRFLEGPGKYGVAKDMLMPPKDRWLFKNVFATNRTDTPHPRFFHLQMYAVASLFPNTFSNWFAVINLFWFILTGIVLYFLSRLILKNNLTALLPTLLWGFSGGAVSMTYYIRAYATAVFFAVLFLYLSCLLIDKDRSNIKIYIFLAIAMFFGFFSHYYFIAWAFFVSAFTAGYLLFTKRYKDIIKYAGAVVLGMGINLLLFYNMIIMHIFHYPAQSMHTPYKLLISASFREINQYVFDNSLGLIFIVLGLILILFVAVIIKRNLRTVDGDRGEISFSVDVNKTVIFNYKTLILLSSILYFILVAYVAPSKPFRYFYICTPTLVLLLIIIFDYSLSFILRIKQIAKHLKFDKEKIKNALLAIIVFILVLGGFHSGNRQNRPLLYYYPVNLQFIQVLSNANFIALTDGNNSSLITSTYNRMTDRQTIDRVIRTYKQNDNKWQKDFMKASDGRDNLILVTYPWFETEDILKFLHKNGFQETLLAKTPLYYYKLSRTKQAKE